MCKKNYSTGKKRRSCLTKISEAEDGGLYLDLSPTRRSQSQSQSQKRLQVWIRVARHTPSGMWNLLQLVSAMRPTIPVDVRSPERCVEVAKDARFAGLYVDINTFRHVCDLLEVVPPDTMVNDHDPRIDQFSSVEGTRGGLVLAEDKLLLGAAVFDRSSRTLHYGGTEYSETDALQLCEQRDFVDLRCGIEWSRHPPEDMNSALLGWPVQEVPESQYQSLTESESLHGKMVPPFRFSRPSNLGSVNLVRVWVDEQKKRRRRRRSIGHISSNLVPSNDEEEEELQEYGSYSSPAPSNIVTETFTYVADQR